MTGLDTNVVLRYLFNDDPNQSPRARRIISSLDATNPGWISMTTVLELAWVMKAKKRSTRQEIAVTLEALLCDDSVVVEQAVVIGGAIQRFRSTGAGFADSLISEGARMAGCTRVVTFDEIAACDLGVELL